VADLDARAMRRLAGEVGEVPDLADVVVEEVLADDDEPARRRRVDDLPTAAEVGRERDD